MTSSNARFQPTAWCGHCKRTSNVHWDDLCISCVACGKVLGDSTVWPIPSFMDRKLKKKARRTKIKVTRKVSTANASAESSTNEPQQKSSRKIKVICRLSTGAFDEASTNEVPQN